MELKLIMIATFPLIVIPLSMLSIKFFKMRKLKVKARSKAPPNYQRLQTPDTHEGTHEDVITHGHFRKM